MKPAGHLDHLPAYRAKFDPDHLTCMVKFDPDQRVILNLGLGLPLAPLAPCLDPSHHL